MKHLENDAVSISYSYVFVVLPIKIIDIFVVQFLEALIELFQCTRKKGAVILTMKRCKYSEN